MTNDLSAPASGPLLGLLREDFRTHHGDVTAPGLSAYERSGFTAEGVEGDSSTWIFDLARDRVPDPGHIRIRTQP